MSLNLHIWDQIGDPFFFLVTRFCLLLFVRGLEAEYPLGGTHLSCAPTLCLSSLSFQAFNSSPTWYHVSSAWYLPGAREISGELGLGLLFLLSPWPYFREAFLKSQEKALGKAGPEGPPARSQWLFFPKHGGGSLYIRRGHPLPSTIAQNPG